MSIALPVLAAVLSVTSPGGDDALPPSSADLPEHVPGELVVLFEHPPSATALDAIARTIPGARWRSLRHAPHPVHDPDGVHPLARVRILEFDDDADLIAIRDRLLARGDVRDAHPNFVMRASFVPNDPMYAQQYGPQIVDSEAAWDITQGDMSVLVCVADTGINFDHEEFQTNIWTNPGEIPDNGIDDDNNGFIDDVHGWDGIQHDNDPRDANGHGSHVAGTIAAGLNNGVGIAGMANVTIVPFQVFSASGGGTFEAITEAIYYATDNGFHALNYSGGAQGTDVEILRDAVQYAWDNGMVMVAAAGNNNSGTPFYPAAYPGAIAVAATDSGDNRASFSNFGDYIDVAAPGVDILSCGPSGTSDYFITSGTSMASPHTAGLVALMHSLDLEISNQDVRDLLQQGADDLGDAGFDPLFGWGRINAHTTLQLMLDRTLTISLPDGTPETVDAGVGTDIAVTIREHNGHTIEPGSETLFYRPQGGDWTPVQMTAMGGGDYLATLPAQACGDDPDFYFSVSTTGGDVVTLPGDAPASFFSTRVGSFVAILSETFESDTGWTVQNAGATTGDWERGVVNDDPSWPWDPTGDSQGDGFAFVTGNSGRDDVDRGSTILTSPTLDLSGGAARISFDLFLNQNRSNLEDGVLVEIDANDGAGPWTPIADLRTSTASWRRYTITQDDLDAAGVVKSSSMRLRLTATDASPEGVVEAGLDGVTIEVLACSQCIADFEGDGDTDADDFFAFLDAFAASDPRADLDGDGDWDAGDFFAFLDAFVQGC